ncbi:hypothetical protein [Modestobacter versicolor]|uniref:hypothetical protein n=1 Tax=Modestobacter versicolor TaxID=429133 RepID=UPI0034DE0F8E
MSSTAGVPALDTVRRLGTNLARGADSTALVTGLVEELSRPFGLAHAAAAAGRCGGLRPGR